jgi:DNA-binding transcriptional LysR family regulator
MSTVEPSPSWLKFFWSQAAARSRPTFIRNFLAVCETLNFTRAAENCNVSQPALTRAVHKLEEELGGLLLRRENNLTHLTDFGRLVRPHLVSHG